MGCLSGWTGATPITSSASSIPPAPGSSGKETQRTQHLRPFQPLALVGESRTLPKPRNAFRLLRPAARPCQRDPGTPTPSSFADLDLTEDVPSSFADLDLTEDVALRGGRSKHPWTGGRPQQTTDGASATGGTSQQQDTQASNAVQPDLTSSVATHPRLWIGVPCVMQLGRVPTWNVGARGGLHDEAGHMAVARPTQ